MGRDAPPYRPRSDLHQVPAIVPLAGLVDRRSADVGFSADTGRKSANRQPEGDIQIDTTRPGNHRADGPKLLASLSAVAFFSDEPTPPPSGNAHRNSAHRDA